MYQNCCKKCGSISLHTEVKGNNTGLYCDDCGSWIKWLSKDELRAFAYSQNCGQRADTNPVDEISTETLARIINITARATGSSPGRSAGCHACRVPVRMKRNPTIT